MIGMLFLHTGGAYLYLDICFAPFYYKFTNTKLLLQSSQLGNQLNLTCQSTGKTATYVLTDPNNTEAIKNLCVGLCS
jgi:hypothetical protein